VQFIKEMISANESISTEVVTWECAEHHGRDDKLAESYPVMR
jgi:hypothetical protein